MSGWNGSGRYKGKTPQTRKACGKDLMMMIIIMGAVAYWLGTLL